MTTSVGIAGLGTVGAELVAMIQADRRFSSLGMPISISGVSARHREQQRPVPLSEYRWFDNPVELASDAETDIFVELIGGAEGVAREAVTAALKAGKSVVTANKALIAAHGIELAKLAEAQSVALKFEAAVAGGTPVVSGIGQGLVATSITEIRGILNGTCNFVLDQMTMHGAAYEQAVKDAQQAGYAEADPSFDVDGIDAAQKLAILATLAFDGVVDESLISVTGISGITPSDIDAARRLGCAIKLVCSANRENGQVTLRVSPNFVPQTHPFAAAEGAGNAVSVKADPLGELLFTGPGAGAGATAAAVAADICAIVQCGAVSVFPQRAEDLGPLEYADASALKEDYAVLLRRADRTEAGQQVSAEFEALNIPIRYCDENDGEITLVTSSVTESRLQAAQNKLISQGLAAEIRAFPLLSDPITENKT